LCNSMSDMFENY